jgi:signal transduction histidine kinase
MPGESLRKDHSSHNGLSLADRLSSVERPSARFAVQVAVLSVYGLAFVLLRQWAAEWATLEHFSMWFPAAGLRFAYIWFSGARVAPFAALAELVLSYATGLVEVGTSPLLSVAGVVGPCLFYGLAIHVVRRSFQARSTTSDFDPLPFGTAMIIAPTLAAAGGLASVLPNIDLSSVAALEEMSANLLVFVLGDLLGILLLAPPLLAIAERLVRGTPLPLFDVRAGRWLEMLGLLGLSWALVWALHRLQFGVILAPVLLATCWCGLRSGRLVAWTAILISALVILPMPLHEAQRLQAHMLLACIAAGGYLVGSYAEAQARAAREIHRRDRLLLQAERLKSLRAMSLGVIHEVTQPLATLALEAESLTRSVSGQAVANDEVIEMAERIARKTNDLSNLVRRLRRFGESGSDERSLIQPQSILNDVCALVKAELESAGVRLVVSPAPDTPILVSDVELKQALLNLVRNAIEAAAKQHSAVWVSCFQDGSSVAFAVENAVEDRKSPAAGMRIGLFIARAIAQAHGGSIAFDHPRSGRIRCILRLPTETSSVKE